ncbi:hypothetical protein [Actinomycetospora sp. NBC_00405]
MVEVETDTAYEQGRWRHATTYVRLRGNGDPAALPGHTSEIVAAA